MKKIGTSFMIILWNEYFSMNLNDLLVNDIENL